MNGFVFKSIQETQFGLNDFLFFFKRTLSCVWVGMSIWEEFKKEVISIKIHSIKILRKLKQCYNVKQLIIISQRNTYAWLTDVTKFSNLKAIVETQFKSHDLMPPSSSIGYNRKE